MDESKKLTPRLVRAEIKEHERDLFVGELRAAREAAQRNVEDFHELLFVIERLGFFLTAGTGNTMGDYRQPFVEFVRRSPLAAAIEKGADRTHIPFETLYFLVNRARNDALHQGAFARHLTTHAVELALILEDALMNGARLVRDFMVREPVCAELWQPISFIRQKMLENAFSYLPVRDDRAEPHRWKLISDRRLARWLLKGRDERQRRLSMQLVEALGEGVELELPHEVTPTDEVEKVFANEVDNGRPVLVLAKAGGTELIGIVMPFDVL